MRRRESLKREEKLLEEWFKFNPIVSLKEGMTENIAPLPDRKKSAFNQWLRHLEMFYFDYSSEAVERTGDEYFLHVFFIRYIQIELFKFKNIKIHTWNPLFWIEELNESIFYITIRDSINLGLRKEAMRQLVMNIPRYVHTAKYWMLKSSIPRNYYRKAVNMLGLLQNYLAVIGKWLKESQYDKKMVDKIVDQAIHALDNFELFMKDNVELKTLSVPVERFVEYIELHTDIKLDTHRKMCVELLQSLREEYYVLCGEYIKLNKEGVPLRPLERSKYTRRLIYKNHSFENNDQVRDYVDNLIFSLKRLIQDNKIMKVPRDPIRTDWSPPFYRRQKFMYVILSPLHQPSGVSKVFLSADDFESDRLSGRPVMSSVRLEIDIIRKVIPGEYLAKVMMKGGKFGKEFPLSDEFAYQGWGYFIMEYLFSLDYRGGEIEYRIEFLRSMMDLAVTALAEIDYFGKKKSSDEIQRLLIEEGLLSVEESEMLFEEMASSFGRSILVLSSYIDIKNLFEKSEEEPRTFFNRMCEHSIFPLSILRHMISSQPQQAS